MGNDKDNDKVKHQGEKKKQYEETERKIERIDPIDSWPPPPPPNDKKKKEQS
ncbi:MAG: hypothetical protein IT392_02070 [Nitrospirae bacterium]|nr:hypothetical protein [Nitrospirota bacterium]